MPRHHVSYSSGHSAHRTHRAPEPNVSLAGKPGLAGTHNGRILTVTDNQHLILQKANKAIEDTWKALDKGSANRIYSDAWPLYGRADKEQNYDLSKHYRIVKEYAPQAANPELREALLYGDKASHREVNRAYRTERRRRGMPIAKKDVDPLKHIARRHTGETYQQLQASRNINMYYQTESGGDDTELRPEMKRSVYESRRRRQDAAAREEIRMLLYNINRGV